MLNKNFLKPPYLSTAGIVSDIVYRFDKNGNKWALVSLDTLNESLQLYVFNETFSKYNELIQKDKLLYIIGKDFNNSESERMSRIIVSKVFIINKDLKKLLTQNINISINYNNHNKEIVESIEKLSNKFPGNYNLVLHLKSLKGINQKVLIKKLSFLFPQNL